jgi:predicted aldo/keto reductase-like oxidoreductase
MSFHDSAEVLDKILTDRPEIEVVQLQLNYVDWIDPRVQAEKCYEVCVKHGKPVLVMEPVKGGSLVNLPQEAAELLTDYSQAGYALRFAASPENVFMVLSGMSNTEQMADNLHTMGDFKPLEPAEYEIIDKVRTIYQGQNRVPCTACRYCVDGCPAGIPIPDLFAAFNEYRQEKRTDTEGFEKAAECVECGQCEDICPQKLSIRELLKEVAATAK